MSTKRWILDNLASHWNWIMLGVFFMVFSFVIRSTSNYPITEPIFLLIFCTGFLIVLGSIVKPPKSINSTAPVRISTRIDTSLGPLQIIRAIHNDLSEDKREYDRLIFAIPSVVSAIDAAFLGLAYGYIKEPMPRLVLLFTAMLLTSVMVIANIKHRYFSNIITENLMVLEHRLRWTIQRVTTPERMFEVTKSRSPNLRIDMKKPNAIQRISAHMAVRNVMIIVIGFLAVLALRELLILTGFNLGM